MPNDLDLTTCRAEFEAASRKPHLAEVWFYEWGQRLLDACENLREETGQLNMHVVSLGAMMTAPAPSPPEIVMPEPDEAGIYYFPDGSYVMQYDIANWIACRKNGKFVGNSDGWLARFDTPLDAARALAALGESSRNEMRGNDER